MTKANDLHDKHNLFPEKRNYHLSHSYDRKTQTWQFMGWRCMKCGVVFKHESTIHKHEFSCRHNLKRDMKDPTSELRIINVNRQPWKPLDFNQSPGS